MPVAYMSQPPCAPDAIGRALPLGTSAVSEVEETFIEALARIFQLVRDRLPS